MNISGAEFEYLENYPVDAIKRAERDMLIHLLTAVAKQTPEAYFNALDTLQPEDEA